MARSDDDYRTLKPTEDADDHNGSLAPPRKAPPPPRRPAPRPAPPVDAAAEAPVAPTLPPGTPPARREPPAERPAPPAEPLRLAGKLARPFARLFPLGDEAGRLLDDKQTLPVYLYRLMKERLFVDAVRLLAHALPPREGIRWACDCATASPAVPAGTAALEAAESWLAAADEPNRRACGAAASAAGYATPAGAAALAVFLSGGSIAPAGRPAAPPAEHLAARAVANAVVLAALAAGPGMAAERYFQFLKEGIALAAPTRS